jgi:hypothetical protein
MSCCAALRRILLCLVILTEVAHAETHVIHGVVHSSGHPVVGATVITTHDVAVTDDAGYFTLTTSDSEVTVAADGYDSPVVPVAETLDIELKSSADSEVIEVKSRAPVETKALGYKLDVDEVRELPGAGNDALRATQMLPGVARIPFGFGGLVLRGTSPRDSAVYLDGIEVPFAYHFGGMTSFFPTALLDSLTVTPGGFDAEYGRAEGGIVTMTSREPRRDRWRVGGALGLLDSGASVEGPLGPGAIAIGVRRSYFDSVATPFVSRDIPLPSYWDAQVRTSFGDLAHGRIAPEMFLSIDRVANNADGLGTERIAMDSMFVRAAVPYTRAWGPLTLKVVPWLGTDRLTFEDTKEGRTEKLGRPSYTGGLRANVVREMSWGHVAGGLDVQSGYLTHAQVGVTGNSMLPALTDGSTTLSWTDLGAWTEARVRLGKLAIKPGLRVDSYGLTSEIVVDPRLAAVLTLTDSLTLRAGLGRYHQAPTPGDVDPQNGNPQLKSSYFDQASLGLDASNGETTASLTGFVSEGYDLGVAMPTANATSPADTGGLGPTFQLLLEKELGFAIYRENLGRARSFGGELSIKHHSGPWFGMLSYTLSKSQRDDSPMVSTLGWRPFDLDQRHAFDAAGSVALGDWRLGARFQLVSGDPYTPYTCVGATCTPHPWAGTLPWFYELDLRADRRWRRPWGDVDVYLDIRNATDHRNVEGRTLDMTLPGEHNISGLPILPFVGVELVPR